MLQEISCKSRNFIMIFCYCLVHANFPLINGLPGCSRESPVWGLVANICCLSQKNWALSGRKVRSENGFESCLENISPD